MPTYLVLEAAVVRNDRAYAQASGALRQSHINAAVSKVDRVPQ